MPDADAVLDGMMESLLSKELIYEPMQQVVARFPAWLEEQKDRLDPVELTRRKEQYDCFRQIVQVYEQDSNQQEPHDMGALMELMSKVQGYGQPPLEIIRDIAPDITLDDNGELPKFPFTGGDEGCTIS